MKKIKPNSIIACDMDGTLCEGEAFTDEDCINAKPLYKMISFINDELYGKKHCFIIIHTARKEFLRNATTYWLNKYGVKYHILACGKLWSSVYIDDRAINIKDL